MKVAFYVSGHGLGHATRAVVTVEELAKRNHHVVVVAANGQLFSPLCETYPGLVSLRIDHNAIDPGVAQKDAVSVDVEKSVLRMGEFLKTADVRVQMEVEWLSLENCDAVLLDAPFIPTLACKILAIPSILVTNFTFDAIFEGLLRLDTKTHNQTEFLFKSLISFYDKVDFLLRLPGAIPNPFFDKNSSGFEFGSFLRGVSDASDCNQPDSRAPIVENLANLAKSFPDTFRDASLSAETVASKLHSSSHIFPPNARVLNLPLVVRMAKTPRSAFRASLGIPDDAKVVLITFGGHSVTSTTPGRSRSNSPERKDVAHPHSIPNSTAPSSQRTLSGNNVDISADTLSTYNRDQHQSPTLFHSMNGLVPEGWHTLIAVPGPKGDLLEDYIESTDPQHISIAPVDAFVPDLVQASDVVVGKCGYGTCAEVVAHGVPLVYVPRPAFVEEVGLVYNLMKPFGMGIEMEDFYAGHWAHYILKGHELKKAGPAMRIRTNGEFVAVDCVEGIVKTGKLMSS